jgi:hypothetical protein
MREMKRIYHTWDKWECYPAGFYANKPPNDMTMDEAQEVYRGFLADIPEFKRVMRLIIKEWKNSCEHYLTNENMNRIAYMGQASLAYKFGIPSVCRGGFYKLSAEQQRAANEAALEVINEWMISQGYPTYTMETIASKTEANLY